MERVNPTLIMDEIKHIPGDEELDIGDSEDAEEEEEEEEEEMGSSPLDDHGSLMMALASTSGMSSFVCLFSYLLIVTTV